MSFLLNWVSHGSVEVDFYNLLITESVESIGLC